MKLLKTWFAKVFIISVLLIVTLVGLNFNKARHNTNKNQYESYAVKSIKIINKRGLIADEQKWKKALKRTHYGHDITNYQQLSYLVKQANKHSTIRSPETVTYNQSDDIFPSLSLLGKYQVINVPRFYSAVIFNKDADRLTSKYIRILTKLIDKVASKQVVILNFAGNVGGDVIPMVIGSASLIPNGTLWRFIDKEGKATDVKLTKNRFLGQDKINSTKYKAHGKIDRPVIAIVDNRTASSGELMILALKRNKRVITIGQKTAGFTSGNEIALLDKKRKIFLNYTNSKVEALTTADGRNIFFNQPIVPDIITENPPIINRTRYDSQGPISDVFWKEAKGKLEKHGVKLD